MTEATQNPAPPAALSHRQILIAFSGLVLAMLLAAQRLVSARRAHLTDLAEEWNPKHEGDAAAYLREAVKDLIPDVRQVG